MEARLGRRRRAYPHPYNAIRKMACSFGWDWGPDLQTAGIWKPVRLERWDTARLARVRPLVTVDSAGAGRVEVHLEVDRAADFEYVAVVEVGGRTGRVAVTGDTATVSVLVPDVRRWWPIGHGDQPLYDLTVTLLAGGQPVDRFRRRVGFRTVTVDTQPDDVGTGFTFVINGKRIFAKGANWIPDDHFLTRITPQRIARRIDQAVGANMNMLRVWGGGIYETDDFYDACDDRGVLVWQDFPFACAFYAEEEPLRGEVEAEARENITRLVAHPSLVLWNGNNENLPAFTDWAGWRDSLQGRSWGLGYYTDLLPGLVAELDPTRPYAPGSPYSPGDLPPNDAHHGTRHEWDVWNALDYTHYRDHVPRFSAEFGFQGPPTWTTLHRWMHEDEPLTPTAPTLLLHQKAEDGNGKLRRGLEPHLPVPAAFEQWHWATQLNQARAVAFGIEHFRSWWPRTAGALVWQLNDCWPAVSWSAVDSDERPKPLYYALKHAFAARLLTVQPRDGGPTLVAVNDHDEPWTGAVHATRQTFAGEVLATAELPLRVPPRSTAHLELADELRKPADERLQPAPRPLRVRLARPGARRPARRCGRCVPGHANRVPTTLVQPVAPGRPPGHPRGRTPEPRLPRHLLRQRPRTGRRADRPRRRPPRRPLAAHGSRPRRDPRRWRRPIPARGLDHRGRRDLPGPRRGGHHVLPVAGLPAAAPSSGTRR